MSGTIYRAGDTVLMLRPDWNSLLFFPAKWGGPFVISGLAGLSCWLQDDKKKVTNKGIHAGSLKPYVARN